MECSNTGKALIRKHEGVVPKVYIDPVGVRTGYIGHTGPDVDVLPVGTPISKAQGEKWFKEDVQEAEDIVNNAVKVDLPQECFDAICSFVFNVGHGRADKGSRRGKDGFVVLRNGKPSTMLVKINRNDLEGAADELEKWVSGTDKDGKRKKLAGLVRRRLEEKALFLKGLHEEDCESGVVADEEEKPKSMAREPAVQATGAVTAAAVIADQADKVSALAPYSEAIMFVFIALTILGLIYALKSKK